MNIFINQLTKIGSDNGLSPGRCQAIIWTNAGILLIGPLGTNFSENLSEIYTSSLKKIHLKMSLGKWQPFCLGLNVLMLYIMPWDDWRNFRHHSLMIYEFTPESLSWWRHQMETFSALLAICAGNSPVPGEFPAQRPVTRSFDVFFDLRLNKRLSKQPWGWWFETPAWSLWRHHNVKILFALILIV